MLQKIVLALALCMGTTAVAKDIIRCTSKGEPDVVITLGAERMLKRPVNCISGDFIVDMVPCAPNGSFGLSAPTGVPALSAIVDRWQDYADHTGGVTSHFINQSTIYFAGGYNGERYTEFWNFKADRLTGTAKLKLEEEDKDKREVSYSCVKAVQRF